MNIKDAIKLIKKNLKKAERSDGEITLLGNGINSCEASQTLKWVLSILNEVSETEEENVKNTWESKLNIIRGKNLVGQADKTDVDQMFEYIDTLEKELDIQDSYDTFGTEGWRHYILGEDS